VVTRSDKYHVLTHKLYKSPNVSMCALPNPLRHLLRRTRLWIGSSCSPVTGGRAKLRNVFRDLFLCIRTSVMKLSCMKWARNVVSVAK
jgi:hypothetical protein